MAENIPLLNESMNGARLAGVVDYLRHQKRDVYYGFVGPAREEGQPTNKANQAYFTQRDWLGGETLQRGAASGPRTRSGFYWSYQNEVAVCYL